ncbi:unnamed protein product [Symbiodinium natans]|uniref:Uncharacterized protein n=1 Tax=Symbiodinium natans TaxID=878477 RepID=A0A812KDJ4_9DINO|nr:unnamed protein product [Symbiodinium natans]
MVAKLLLLKAVCGSEQRPCVEVSSLLFEQARTAAKVLLRKAVCGSEQQPECVCVSLDRRRACCLNRRGRRRRCCSVSLAVMLLVRTYEATSETFKDVRSFTACSPNAERVLEDSVSV